jgi:hypothetical protein
MKKINIEIIKDFIISFAIILAIVLVLSILLYDKTSLTKIVPVAEEYKLSDKMNEEMQEQVLEENKDLITTYYLDASDLRKYEKSSEQYRKGKANPFAEESSQAEDDNSNSTNASTSTKKNETTNSEGFYDNGGLK